MGVGSGSVHDIWQSGFAAGMSFTHSAVVTSLLSDGEYEHAYGLSRRLVQLVPGEYRTGLLPDLIEAAVHVGCPDEARAALAELERAAGSACTPRASGVLARCVALTTDGPTAEEWFERSLALLQHTAAEEAARTRLLYGEWLRRRRRRREAAQQLGEALAVFASRDMDLRRRAEREIALCGAARLTPDAALLTPQEEAVAALAAAGATNAEIATKLFISRHTVDWHLRKVYRKLSLTGRRQLVRWLPRAGDGEPRPSVSLSVAAPAVATRWGSSRTAP